MGKHVPTIPPTQDVDPELSNPKLKSAALMEKSVVPSLKAIEESFALQG